MISIYIILLLASLYLIYRTIYKTFKQKYNLPPSLPTTPLLGNSSYLSKPLFYVDINRKYRKQFKNYLTIWYLNQPILIINDYRKLVDLFVNQHSVDTAGRPFNGLFYLLTEGNKDIIASTLNNQWIFQRKLAHSALRKFAQNIQLDHHVRNSFNLFKAILIEKSKNSAGSGIYPNEESFILTYNITSAIAFGKTFQMTDINFIKLRESIDFINHFIFQNVVYQLVPLIHHLPLPGIRKFKSHIQFLLNYLDLQVSEHKDSDQYLTQQNDILDYILQEKASFELTNDSNLKYLNDTYIRQILLDIFLAGTDTTALTTNWMLALLATHQDVKEKIKQEVFDYELRMDKEISVTDKPNLNYTQAVLNEILRFSSIVPFAVMHEALKDIHYDGYIIPKGTKIIPNLYEFNFDKQYWDDPHTFNPDRFLDENGVLVPKKDGWMPFSCGRRVCVGESVAKADLFLILCLICKDLELEWCTKRNGSDKVQECSSNTQFRYTAEYFINITESK